MSEKIKVEVDRFEAHRDELRGHVIDPKELRRKMLDRLAELKAQGYDTPTVEQAIRQLEQPPE